jgi:hypothetical protein
MDRPHRPDPLSQYAEKATMNPLDLLILEEETREKKSEKENMIVNPNLVPISQDSIEATMDPLTILVREEDFRSTVIKNGIEQLIWGVALN